MTAGRARRAFLYVAVCLSACSCEFGAAGEAHRWLTGTVPAPGPAGERVEQPGISFSPPSGKTWYYLGRSTEQTTLGARGSSNDETYVTAVTMYQLPSDVSPDAFLAWVKAQRATEPETLRFERLRNDEERYAERPEVCVKYRATSKDYGMKRGGEFPLLDMLGMHCIHPSSPRVAVLVELSRKAPTPADATFDADGIRLLQSVRFMPFE